MDLSAYFEYLEEFAGNHKSIGHTSDELHFFRTDVEELDNAKRSKIHYPAVAALNPTINTSAQISTNVRVQYQGAIVLLDRISDRGNNADRSAKEADLIAIVEDFITKFINDRRTYELSKKGYTLPGLNLGGFMIDLVPNTYTSVCGVMLSFNWNEPLKQFDASKWNNVSRHTV